MKLSNSQKRKIIRACAKGVKIDVLAEQFGVSARTIDRIVACERVQDKTFTVKRGRPRKMIPALVVSQPGVEPDPAVVDQIVNYLIKTPFPYPASATPEQLAIDLERLSRRDLAVIDSVITPRDSTGIRVCRAFFPNRFEATWRGTVSARTAWNLERVLRRAVRFQMRHGDPVTPHRVLRALTLVCRTPTIFKPSIAKFIYKRYCSPGERVWDPCAGYGGRLLGAHAAGVVYTATDVEARTVEGNLALAKAISANAEVYCARAETFSPSAIDFVFTSPPYFDRERYSHNENQSWKQHGETLEAWIEGFLRPVVVEAFAALRGGRHLVLNIADIKDNSTHLPLATRTVAVALESGFHHVETLLMPLAAINRTAPAEPVLVFQKPI